MGVSWGDRPIRRGVINPYICAGSRSTAVLVNELINISYICFNHQGHSATINVVSHFVATVLLYRNDNFTTLYYKIFKFQYNVEYSIATNVADNNGSARHSQCGLTIKPLNKNEEMNEKQNE